MNKLCMIIKDMVKPNFLNIRTSIQTYDRNALCCGAPCWRWVYHTLHSADKWFINPFVYEEPEFHEDGMDDPDKPCSVVLSNEQFKGYGTEILKQGFCIAKEHGMDKVLMNINDENLVSAHICEKLGGKLMDKIPSYNDAEGHHVMRRYWIFL